MRWWKGPYPVDFGKELTKRFGRSPLSFDTVEPHDARAKHAMVVDLARSARMRMEMLRAFLTERRDDLTLITVSETHKAGHYLAAPEQLAPSMSELDGVAEVLREVDFAWPEILSAAGPDCHVGLFALHGMQHQVDYGHFGTQLLSLLGGEPPADHAGGRDLVRRVRDLMPDALRQWVWRTIPARMRSARVGALTLAGVDLSRDKLFRTMHDGHAAVRVNLIGRETPGLVSESGRDPLLRAFEDLALEYTADDGQRAFTELLRPQEQFPGPRAHRLPDGLLLTNFDVKGTNAIHRDGETLTSTVREARNGVHTGRGFAYFRTVGGGMSRETMDALDFAPTVLELLGVAPTTELHGSSVLTLRG